MSHLFRSSRLFRSHYCFHLLLCRCLIKRAVQVCEPDDPTSTILLWLPCGQDRAGCLAHRQEILAHKADSRHMGPCHKSVYGNPSEPWHGSSRQLCGALCVCVCSGELSCSAPPAPSDFTGEGKDSVLHRTDLFASHQHTRMRRQ